MMFNVTQGLKKDTLDDMFETFQRTGNINDHRAGNAGRKRAAFTDANVEVIQQVNQERPRVSVRRVASQV